LIVPSVLRWARTSRRVVLPAPELPMRAPSIPGFTVGQVSPSEDTSVANKLIVVFRLGLGLLVLASGHLGVSARDRVSLLARDQKVPVGVAILVPAKGEKDGHSDVQEPPSEQDTDIAPDVRRAVRETVKVLFTSDLGNAWKSATNTSTGLVSSIGVARTVGNKVVVDTRNDTAFELVSKKGLESIGHRVDPVDPHEPRVHLGLGNLVTDKAKDLCLAKIGRPEKESVTSDMARRALNRRDKKRAPPLMKRPEELTLLDEESCLVTPQNLVLSDDTSFDLRLETDGVWTVAGYTLGLVLTSSLSILALIDDFSNSDTSQEIGNICSVVANEAEFLHERTSLGARTIVDFVTIVAKPSLSVMARRARVYSKAVEASRPRTSGEVHSAADCKGGEEELIFGIHGNLTLVLLSFFGIHGTKSDVTFDLCVTCSPIREHFEKCRTTCSRPAKHKQHLSRLHTARTVVDDGPERCRVAPFLDVLWYIELTEKVFVVSSVSTNTLDRKVVPGINDQSSALLMCSSSLGSSDGVQAIWLFVAIVKRFEIREQICQDLDQNVRASSRIAGTR
ncbi:pleiotropic drug resistance protein, ABC superfamily, partial [Aureobasidium melanogenum]